MNMSEINKYYDGYNSGSFAVMAESYYHDDIVFEIQGIVKLDGKKAVVDWFAQIGTTFKEVITTSSIILGGDKMAVEAESHFTAKDHIPDLFGQSIELKPGESATIQWGGFYKIRDEKFCRIKLYT